jgi:hypothetical protein
MGEVVSTTKISDHDAIGYQVQSHHCAKSRLILPKTKYGIKTFFFFLVSKNLICQKIYHVEKG